MDEYNEMREEYYLEKELLAPCRHAATLLKKLAISKMVRSFNFWLRVSEDDFRRATEVEEMVANAVFVIDDIQDNSTIRREVPTAHLIYGIPLTINSAVQLLAEASRKAFDLVPNGLAAKLLAEKLHKIWIGQGTEIYWINNFICPTEEQYRTMTLQKTGAYISCGVKLLQLLSKDKRDYDKLLSILGYYAQVQDDYCNLSAQELNNEDRFWEDLTEGKFSLPIIHASKTSVGPEVLRILKMHTRDVNLKKYCLSLLEKAGSLQYTRDKLSELDREARKEIARLGHNPLLESALDDLNSWRNNKMFP